MLTVKKKYEAPEIELLDYLAESVLTSSFDGSGEGSGEDGGIGGIEQPGGDF